MVKTVESDASLGAGAGDQVLPGFTGAGFGSLGEKEPQAPSEIIEALNDRLRHELTGADQLVIEQHVLTATGDEDLRGAAKANSLENTATSSTRASRSSCSTGMRPTGS